jgi:hypothetical protein
MWIFVRIMWEAEGYDQDAYEYAFAKRRHGQQTIRESEPGTSNASTLLVRLGDGPVNDATAVMTLAGLDSVPTVFRSLNDESAVMDYCVVDATSKERFLRSLLAMRSPIDPKLSQDSMATKDLSTSSPFPTLGIDSTLPQFRPSQEGVVYSPTQHQYPVWYFFYDALQEPAVLSRPLAVKQMPNYRRARIHGGRLGPLAGSGQALFDDVEGQPWWRAQPSSCRRRRTRTNFPSSRRISTWL